MKLHYALLLISALLSTTDLSAFVVSADSIAGLKEKVGDKQVFRVNNPDMQLSPHTGLSRKHWKEAALYLLSGAFDYVKTGENPMHFPKQPGKSYPRDGKPNRTENLEGLCRTMFMAAPLLKEDSSLRLHGVDVAGYYRRQLALLLDSTIAIYVPKRSKNGGPSQTLVEFGGLSVSLFSAPEVFWDPLPKTVKDSLASTMLSYGNGPTIDMNWRFFNIFIMSFFKSRGYEVNDASLKNLLEKSLNDYKGDGWYNDRPYYDYYSMWAFQMYGMLWSEYFGKKHYPEYAARFLQNFRDLQDNYPYMFARNGNMIMWGRSIAYRIGAAVPFPLMGLTGDSQTNYGWMRRIASGTLLQFLKNPELLEDGIPTLGFYGAFEPAVQQYSCRGSVFWMGKLFLGLFVPEDSAFWTAKENEGAWENELKKGNVYNKFAEGSEILITDYPNIGAAEIRAWCYSKDQGYYQGTENYNRLSYNSAFPWQADGDKGEVAMNYVVKNKEQKWEAFRMFRFRKYEEGIYYRDVVLASDSLVRMNLADITLPNGILRIDRNISSVPADVRLGHYALPVLKGDVKSRTMKVKVYEIHIMDNGVYQLAMVALRGWGNPELVHATGLHPESMKSAVFNVSTSFKPGDKQGAVYATLMLWKKSGEKWSTEELVPVKELRYSAATNQVNITMSKGQPKVVSFD
ncbi:MAG: DUF2264 domain-containing protein [Arcticibacter sp.]